MRRPDNGRLVAAGTNPKPDKSECLADQAGQGSEWIVIAWPDRPTTVSPAKYSEANASIELAARPYKVRQDDTGEDE